MKRVTLFFLLLAMPFSLLANEINHIFTGEVLFILFIIFIISISNIPLLIAYCKKKNKNIGYFLIIASVINTILGIILVVPNDDLKLIGSVFLSLGLYSVVYTVYNLISKREQSSNIKDQE